MIALLSSAFAGPLPGDQPSDPSGVRVVVRGVVEQWDEPALSSVYRSGAWLGGAGIVVPVIGPVLVDVEASFRRLTNDAGATFEIAPLSALVELGPRHGTVEPYVGLGPTWTAFSEHAGTAVQGAKLAGELRGGLRIDTGLVRPPMPPASDGPVRALEVEVYVARRATMPGGAGLSLGAWRGSLGIGVAF